MNHQICLLDPIGIAVLANTANETIASLDISQLKDLFDRHQLVVLRGFAAIETTDDFTSFCERWGEISVWPFGKVLNLIEQVDPQDHIFDHSHVPLHWDGMYRPFVPEYQIFRCLQAPLPGQGGRTTFSHTTRALELAALDHKKIWNRATGIYRREMEFYRSKTVSPIVSSHPRTGQQVIRYNEPSLEKDGKFINPADLSFQGVSLIEEEILHASLKDALYDPRVYYAHEWQSGDIVIADNFTLLHGREKFVTGAPRHIQRVHVLSDPPLKNPALRSHE